MSYNPVRAKGTNFSSRKKIIYKNHGVKHSDIARKKGVGAAAPLSNKEITFSGFRSESFSCDNFVQYYERIDAGNNKGFGVNRSGDRVIFIVSGSLFVTRGSIDEDNNVGEKTNLKVSSGGYVSLPRSTAYSIATSGTLDAELLVTETPDYDKSFELLGEVTIREVMDKPILAPKTETPVSTRRNKGKRSSSQAMKAAKNMERQKRRARARQGKNVAQTPAGTPLTTKQAPPSTGNANSSTTIGVNPKPFIPTEE